MIRFHLLLLTVITLLPQTALPADAEWGHLRGRFVFDGDPPPVRVFPINRDNAVFGDTIEDESLIVNAKNRGVANVIVYLQPKKEVALRVHPSYDATANATVDLATQGGRYVPHVVLMRTTQA